MKGEIDEIVEEILRQDRFEEIEREIESGELDEIIEDILSLDD